jgi:hypothetical protein
MVLAGAGVGRGGYGRGRLGRSGGVEEAPEFRHRCSPRRQLWSAEREREREREPAGGGNESGAV